MKTWFFFQSQVRRTQVQSGHVHETVVYTHRRWWCRVWAKVRSWWRITYYYIPTVGHGEKHDANEYLMYWTEAFVYSRLREPRGKCTCYYHMAWWREKWTSACICCACVCIWVMYSIVHSIRGHVVFPSHLTLIKLRNWSLSQHMAYTSTVTTRAPRSSVNLKTNPYAYDDVF